MKVLMFGWEYPPHVFGGLATANYGISEGLKAQGDIETVLCLPHPFGDESQHACRIVAMNAVPIAYRDVDYDYVKQRVGNIMDPDYYFKLREHIYADFNYMNVNDLGAMEFAGGYPGNLHEEINNYSIIAGQVARTEEFDIIHAHDWLTFPAGIHTDFDRSRGKVNPTVYSIEKNGMDWADCIMCVSELTRQTVINQYHQDPRKCYTVHNAVYPLPDEYQAIPRPDHTGKEKVVTFLGRITMQKGPEYLAAERGIADRFHFPGFMRGKQVYECLKASDVYVMPSVSEPFGISPLEAMQCGTPSIISKQSGCAEILDNCIKVDYWDIHALADAIYSICHNESLFQYLKDEGKHEVDQITWEKVGRWIRTLYRRTLGWEE